LWRNEYRSAAAWNDLSAASETPILIEPEAIAERLCRMVAATAIDDGVRVSTHVLYPSNGAVTVTVRGGTFSFVVSDDGGALTEILSAGLKVPISDRQISARVRSQGLHVSRGVILSPQVIDSAIEAAIVLVANASGDFARWALEHFRFGVQRDFRGDLDHLLGNYFHDNLKRDTPIIGASTKLHKFNYVIYLDGERRLLVDPVINDHSSISSRVIANLDVRNVHDTRIDQLIVYDDRIRWAGSDLKLLELGARTVPFSHAEPEIRRLAA
jgi:hypothetical protein